MDTAGQTIPRFSRDGARNTENTSRDVPSSPQGSRSDQGSQSDQGSRPGAEPGRGSGCSQGTPRAAVPTDDQVETALARALKSPEFQSAPQLRSFLGFVVRATLNKQQEKIKGYTIAVEALGRQDDFNPVVDPIVRVEAARLRRRLEKYYAGSGSDEPVHITIPKGSYAPVFHSAGSDPEAEQASDKLSAFDGGTTLAEVGPVEDGTSFQPQEEMRDTDRDPPERRVAVAAGAGAAGPVPGDLRSADHRDAARGPTGHPLSLSGRRYSPLLVLAIGTGCFIAGFLAASF